MVSDHAVAFLLTVMVRIGNPITSITSSPACLLSLTAVTVGYAATSPVPQAVATGESCLSGITIAAGSASATDNFITMEASLKLMKTFSQA